MPLDLTSLDNASRLLVKARLTVAPGVGGRFQPTGFPDLGPALYKGFQDPPPSKVLSPSEVNDNQGGAKMETISLDMLLVESVQSMANRLEEVCLKGEDYNDDCQGIPYVRVLDGHRNNVFLTSSVREPHRLASPYVLGAKHNGQVFKEVLKNELNANKERPIHIWKMVPTIFNRDPGCVLHGVFLEEIDGRIRLPRLVSGYIEASSPNTANSGGVYRGEVTAKDNIPYPRQEFTSPSIDASFIFHLATLNGYNLEENRRRFLQLWALYKIDHFLKGHLRLRTACEFDVSEITVYCDGTPFSFSDDEKTKGKWPASDEIQREFVAAKDRCFPHQPGNDEWQQRRVEVVIYAVDIVGQEEIPEGITATAFNLTNFEGRAAVKQVSTGKSGKKKTFNALVLTGEWPEENQKKLLEQNPEKKEDDNGEEVENPAHNLVKAAIKNWNEAWKKQQKKLASTEADEE